MPDPRDNAQQRGDIHPPEVESDLPFEGGMADSPGSEGEPANRGKATDRGNMARPGRGGKQGGDLKDKDEPATGTSGTTRESGEDAGRA